MPATTSGGIPMSARNNVIASPRRSVGDRRPDLLGELLRGAPAVGVVAAVRRLVQHEPGDGQPTRRGPEGQGGTGGVPVHARHTAHDGDQRTEVLDLAVHGVRASCRRSRPGRDGRS